MFECANRTSNYIRICSLFWYVNSKRDYFSGGSTLVRFDGHTRRVVCVPRNYVVHHPLYRLSGVSRLNSNDIFKHVHIRSAYDYYCSTDTSGVDLSYGGVPKLHFINNLSPPVFALTLAPIVFFFILLSKTLVVNKSTNYDTSINKFPFPFKTG